MYPGVVDTPGMRFHWALNIVAPLVRLFVYTPQDSAQLMLYPLLNPEFSKGGYWLTDKSDKLQLGPNITDEVTKKVWDNTVRRAELQ